MQGTKTTVTDRHTICIRQRGNDGHGRRGRQWNSCPGLDWTKCGLELKHNCDWLEGCGLKENLITPDRCTIATCVRYFFWTHPAVQPVLTHHTLNHLVLHLETKPVSQSQRHTNLIKRTSVHLVDRWGPVEVPVCVSPGHLGLGKAGCRYNKLQRSYDYICSDCWPPPSPETNTNTHIYDIMRTHHLNMHCGDHLFYF